MNPANRFDMTGRTALLAGGGTGRGRKIGLTLAHVRATVVLGARRAEPLVVSAAAIRTAGDNTHGVRSDVADVKHVAAAITTHGSIVDVGSILGSAIQIGTANHPTAKAALIRLTRGLAVEWAKFGVRANARAAGYYHSDLSTDYIASEGGKAMLKRMPMRRIGDPQELRGHAAARLPRLVVHDRIRRHGRRWLVEGVPVRDWGARDRRWPR
jgi:NAD(P)-dependent dehydrogenase (short-subunit alcohol dehydrogenase family)